MICIIMATVMEAEPFIGGLALKKIDNDFFKLYQKDHLTLVISGIGKMNASMATTYALTTFSPECIVNLGAAGSLGDVPLGLPFQVKSIVESDRPVRHLNKPRMYTPQLLSGFDDAILATQDIPVLEPNERRQLALSADLIDMEGCAVAHVCKRFKIQCFLYKFVTDNIKNPDTSDIVANIEKYRTSFFEFCASQVLPALETVQ